MSDEFDGSRTLRSPGLEPIRQFVIYAENKVGWLNDFLLMLDEGGIHILAISVLDASDSAVIRLVPNYPKDLARLLKSRSILSATSLYMSFLVFSQNKSLVNLGSRVTK